MTNNVDKSTAKDQLWRRGNLIWKLDSSQKELYNLYYEGKYDIFTWLISRRFGKSHTLLILALEQCIRKPNSIVKYAAPTRLQVTTIIRPLIRKILADCPEDMRPRPTKDHFYAFPNGSELQLAGTDSGNAEKLRGGDSDLAIVDEAGSCSNLDDLVGSILGPTTLTTDGKIILSGTPPQEEDHEFVLYIEKAEFDGSLIRKTILDNPRLTKEQIDKAIAKAGGINSPKTRREYFVELIKNPAKTVIPEYTKDLDKEIVKEWVKPPFYDSYVGMDIGGVDLTGLVFGYFDFRFDKIIIEDELAYDFQETENDVKNLVKLIQEKEAVLWTSQTTGELKEPCLRVSDTDPITLKEIRVQSNYTLNFIPTKKDDKHAAINHLRMLLKAHKVIIHPRCVNLRRHLTNVKWKNDSKNDFGRSADNGHYDLVDALLYFVRNINYKKNPYPAFYDLNLKDGNESFVRRDPKTSGNNAEDVARAIFNVRKKA